MYRNKIVVIFSLMVIALLCVIIWSTNFVAVQEVKKTETAPEPIQIGVPIQHQEDADMTEENSEEESEETEEELPPYEINLEYLVPPVNPDYKRIKVVNRNYTKEALEVTPLILWNTDSFPLKVYLDGALNYPERFEDGIKTGFKNWSSATDNLVSFNFIRNQQDANIIVKVTEKAVNCDNAECPSEYEIKTTGKKITVAYLNIPKVNCEGEELNANDVYTRVQHDVGHILGIGVHSDDKSSVMYPHLSFNNTNITSMDGATLKYLYLFMPDIVNTPIAQYKKEKMLSRDEALSMSEKDFHDLILNKIPDASESEFDKMINSAYDFYQQKNYKKAIEIINKALPLSSGNFEKSYAYRLLSFCYLDDGNASEAHAKALLAVSSLPNMNTKYFLNYVKYKCGRLNEAEAQLEALIKEAPLLVQAYSLLAKVYIDQGKWGRLQEYSVEVKKQFPNDPPFVLNYVPTSGDEE